jgi:hypothetical protein
MLSLEKITALHQKAVRLFQIVLFSCFGNDQTHNWQAWLHLTAAGLQRARCPVTVYLVRLVAVDGLDSAPGTILVSGEHFVKNQQQFFF